MEGYRMLSNYASARAEHQNLPLFLNKSQKHILTLVSYGYQTTFKEKQVLMETVSYDIRQVITMCTTCWSK